MTATIVTSETELSGRDRYAPQEQTVEERLIARLDRAYRLAGLLMGNALEAEDVVAESLERAWRNQRQLRDLSRLDSWFDRIVVNRCRDHARRRRIVQFMRLDGIPDVASPADPFALSLERDRLGRAITKLSFDERTVIVLHFWGDMTLESIALRLNWRPGTVRSRLNRALRKIRDDIKLAEPLI